MLAPGKGGAGVTDGRDSRSLSGKCFSKWPFPGTEEPTFWTWRPPPFSFLVVLVLREAV